MDLNRFTPTGKEGAPVSLKHAAPLTVPPDGPAGKSRVTRLFTDSRFSKNLENHAPVIPVKAGIPGSDADTPFTFCSPGHDEVVFLGGHSWVLQGM